MDKRRALLFFSSLTIAFGIALAVTLYGGNATVYFWSALTVVCFVFMGWRITMARRRLRNG